jgi:hypothetical protein
MLHLFSFRQDPAYSCALGINVGQAQADDAKRCSASNGPAAQQLLNSCKPLAHIGLRALVLADAIV